MARLPCPPDESLAQLSAAFRCWLEAAQKAASLRGIALRRPELLALQLLDDLDARGLVPSVVSHLRAIRAERPVLARLGDWLSTPGLEPEALDPAAASYDAIDLLAPMSEAARQRGEGNAAALYRRALSRLGRELITDAARRVQHGLASVDQVVAEVPKETRILLGPALAGDPGREARCDPETIRLEFFAAQIGLALFAELDGALLPEGVSSCTLLCILSLQVGHKATYAGELALAQRRLSEAVDAARRADDRALEALSLRSLGTCLSRCGDSAGARQALQRAAELFRLQRDTDSEAWALHELGGHECAEARQLSAQGHTEAARRHYTVALEALRACAALFSGQDEDSRVGRGLCRVNLGEALHALGDSAGAYEAYREGLAILDARRGTLQSDAARQGFMESAARHHHRMVRLCLERGETAEAWLWAERAKSRRALDLLASTPQLQDDHALEEWISIQQTVADTVTEIRKQLGARLSWPLPGQPGARRSSALRAEVPAASAAGQLPGLMCAEARVRQRLLRRSVPAASLASSRELLDALGEVAAPLLEQGRRPLLIEYLPEADGDDLCHVVLVPLWERRDKARVPIEHCALRIDRQRLCAPLSTLGDTPDSVEPTPFPALSTMLPRLARRSGRTRSVPPSASQSWSAADEAAVLLAFEGFMAQVSEQLAAPLGERLGALDPTDIVLVPSGALHVMPIHAAFVDRYGVTYLPAASAAVALAGRRRRKRERGLGAPARALVLGPAHRDLPGAESEVRELARFFRRRCECFSFDQMTVAALRRPDRRDALPDAPDIVHLATHSVFEHAAPLLSSIEFANARLTLGHILSDGRLALGRARLVYLSSCESSLAAVDAADEVVSLAWGMLQVGARAVVSSLWAADDRAAKAMSVSFYRLWLGDAHANLLAREGCSLSEAYGQAVAEVRERFGNPYFWAPFVLHGDAWADG